MKAKDIMNSPVVTANEDDSLEQCARRMLELGIAQLPVVKDDGTLTGFIAASDFVAKKKPRSPSREPKSSNSSDSGLTKEQLKRYTRMPGVSQ